MPVHFLTETGKGFFIQKEDHVFALANELADVVKEEAFAEQMGDVIKYRAMNYYQRKYREKE